MTLSPQPRGPKPARRNDSTPNTAPAHPVSGRCAGRSEPDAQRWLKINDEHRASEHAARASVEHAIKCGEMLLDEKARAGHGRWLRWLADNFEGSEDKAQRYMRLAGHKDAIIDPNTAGLRYLSVSEAIDALASSQTEPGQATAPSKASDRARPSPPDDTPDAEQLVEIVPAVVRPDGLPEGAGERVPTRPVPTTVVVGGESPPDRDACARAVPSPRAQARTFDVAGGDEVSLAAATAYLEAAARAAARSGQRAHLLVYCSTDQEGRAALVKALPFVPQEEEEDPFTENYARKDDDKVSPEERKQKRYESRLLRAWAKAERSRLLDIIRAQGGIATPSDLKEEYQGISNAFKNQNGISSDEMAVHLATQHPEFGVRDERSLIDVLSRGLGRVAKRQDSQAPG